MTNDELSAYGKKFAALYDVIRGHRDLVCEVDRVDEILRQKLDAGAAILDLGCGTGSHALELAKRGYQVTGIDLSPDMISAAQSKGGNATFICGNIDANRHLGPFDGCVSLYNVINCLDGLESLNSFFEAVAAVLKPKAPYICECWNPIAVIQSPPTRVVRDYDSELGAISRTASPRWDFMKQQLDIDYDIEIKPRQQSMDTSRFVISHHLCLFTPIEVEFFLKRAGFRDIQIRTALPDFKIAKADDRMLAFGCVKA